MTTFIYARSTPTTKSFRKTKNKGIDKSSPDKRKAKESVVILISYKVEFNPQSIKHVAKKDNCAPNDTGATFLKQELKEFKES